MWGSYSNMATLLLQRLQAAKALLESTTEDDRIALSKAQSDMVLHMMATTEVSPAEVGEVAAAISAAPWAMPGEAASLLQAVGSMVKAKKARVSLQDFEHVCAFLPEPLWKMLLGQSDFFSKAEGILDHFFRLGLRNSTERSVANLTALLLVACEGDAAKSLSQQHVRDTFLHVKGMLKRRVPKSTTPVSRLDVCPIDFGTRHPTSTVPCSASFHQLQPNSTR